MKFRFIVVMLLGLTRMHAETVQQIKSMGEIFDGIGHSTKDVFTFVKSAMEDDSLYDQDPNIPQNKAQLIFGLRFWPRASNDDNETIGLYLNTTTDEKLRAQITKSYIAEGKKLLNDVFNTIVYKKLRKELKKFISAITSCSFISSEESKKLSSLNIFYPDDYKSCSYKWKPFFENNNLCSLQGNLHEVVGLKRNKNSNNKSHFLMVIDVAYECFLGKTQENTLNMYEFNSKNDKNKIASPAIKLYVEPNHSIQVTINFLRQKNNDTFCSALFFCYALGEERISFLDKLENESYCLVNDIEVDTSAAYMPPLISGQCILTSGDNSSIYHDLISQCSNFLIETKE
jgi:hypothetical protein